MTHVGWKPLLGESSPRNTYRWTIFIHKAALIRWTSGAVTNRPLGRWVVEKNSPELIKMDPIPSMYGIFSYIYHKNQPNVDKYSIHGSYGKWIEFPGKFSGANQTFTCYFINTFSIPVGRFQHFNPWKKHMLEPTNQPTNKQTNNKQQTTNKQTTTNNKLEKIGTPGIRGKNTYMIEIKPPNEYMLMFPKIQRNLS